MRCPSCGADDSRVLKTTRMVETPLAEGVGPVKIRRRDCKNCKRGFQTYEVHQVHYEIVYKALMEKRGKG